MDIRARSRQGRSIALATILALIASVLAVGASPSSAAPQAVGDVNLLFSAGGDPPLYGRGQVVRIEVGNINFVRSCVPQGDKKGFPDWFPPTAALYVVGGGATLIEGTSLTDVAGKHNTVFGGLEGMLAALTPTPSTGGGGGAGRDT